MTKREHDRIVTQLEERIAFLEEQKRLDREQSRMFASAFLEVVRDRLEERQEERR